MTQEDKELLLKDLCARLPYGVKIKFNDGTDDVYNLDSNIHGRFTKSVIQAIDDLELKPYLRPMSSMTEEEKEEWNSYVSVPYGKSLRRTPYCIKYMDWLLEHHFDFRHLIEKGLALEATKDMYNIKEK